MKNRSSLSPTRHVRRAIFALVLAAFAFAGTMRAADSHKEEGPMHEAMEEMGRCLRKLNRQVADSAAVDSSKELLAKMKASAEKARELEPSLDKEMPEEERAKWIAKYKKGMDEVIATIGEAEAALGEGKFDVAKEKVGDLKKEKEKGHKEFDVEED